jgi:hypothetical protein
MALTNVKPRWPQSTAAPVDSALMRFNPAQASINSGRVLITGRVKKQQDVQTITRALEKLPVAGIDNRLVVE